MREIELDIEELEVRGCLLNVRLIVEYKTDEDEYLSYSQIKTGDAWSARRNAWIELSVFLKDEIYNSNHKRIEKAIQERIADHKSAWKHYDDMRREFVRTETRAIRAQYGI